MYKSNDENVSPHSDNYEDMANDLGLAFDGDLDMLEAELQFDPLSSDGILKMEVDIPEKVHVETNSDDLFDNDFDNLNPEELEELDLSSNNPTPFVTQDAQETMDEEEVLFGDGYDELMYLDFEETQPEVCHFMRWLILEGGEAHCEEAHSNLNWRFDVYVRR